MTDRSAQPGIRLHSVFLAEAHFSHASDPLEPLPKNMERVTGSAGIQVTVNSPKDGVVAVRVRVSDDPDDKSSRYHFAAELVATFSVDDLAPNMPLREYALRHGAGLLYPFAREAVANLTSRGRFGPVWLNPVNLLGIVDASADVADSDAAARKRSRGSVGKPRPRTKVAKRKH